MRIVVSGGGTGGHIYPAISVAREVIKRHPHSTVVYVGSSTGPEAAAAANAGFRFVGFEISGIAGRKPLQASRAIARFLKASWACAGFYKQFDPGCVVGTGGYASSPACAAAVIRRVPLILHEMNYNPGMVTRLFSRWARAVAVAEEGTGRMIRGDKSVTTGVAVRPEIEELRSPEFRKASRLEAESVFGLGPGRVTMLVFGGSQGSEAINRALWDALPGLRDRADIQILHMTGRSAPAEESLRAEAALSGAPLRYHPVDYSERMDLAYARADLALSRSGAGTIAELTAAGVPSVLVPFPYATDAHQEANAIKLEEKGAAKMVRQMGSAADGAVRAAVELAGRPEELAKMAKASYEAYPGSGAEGIVDLIEELTE